MEEQGRKVSLHFTLVYQQKYPLVKNPTIYR